MAANTLKNGGDIGVPSAGVVVGTSDQRQPAGISEPGSSVGDSAGFDQFAPAYDAALQQGLSATGESKDYFAHGRVQWLGNYVARTGLRPKHILDFGCGTGTSVPLLRSLPGVEAVTGVDTSEESLRVGAGEYGSLGNIQFATLERLPPAGNMDIAFCNGVFHHIPLKDRAGAMRYVFDSLKPGGVFAFWENNPWNPGTRYVMSRIPFDADAITLSPPEAAGLSRAGGFEVLATRFLFFFPRSLAFLRPLEVMMERIPLGGQYIVLCRKPV